MRTEADRALQPESHHVACHTEDHIRQQRHRYLDVCDHLPQGKGMSDQDSVVLGQARQPDPGS